MKILNIDGFRVAEIKKVITFEGAKAATELANAKNLGGFSDWVLPSAEVLKSLSKYGSCRGRYWCAAADESNCSIGFGYGYSQSKGIVGKGQLRLVRQSQVSAILQTG